MPTIRFGDRAIALPANRVARIAIGIALICGGILGFLPILGFWMIPLGLLILSFDIPSVRRWRRRLSVWWASRWHGRKSGPARKSARNGG